MIKKSSPATAAAGVSNEEAQIEVAIARLTGVKSEMFSRMDEILNKFYEFSSVRQVKVNGLVKNPFRLEMLFNQAQKIEEPSGESDADAEFLRRQMVLEQAKKSMQLLSIMQSEQGYCCMINDQILYEGDWIRGFEVKEITGSTVRLEWSPTGTSGGSETEGQDVEIIILGLSE
jgi:hypothetical protein